MRWIVLLALPWLAAGAAASELWRRVDEHGVVHYSDRPMPGAERITVGPAQTYEAPAIPERAATDPALAADEEQQAASYTRLSIVSPAAGETLWNIGGQLNVELAVEPEIRDAHALRLHLDGVPVGGVPEAQTQFTIGDVHRGEHSLRASIVDEQGRELVSSGNVVFYVQQASLLNPSHPARRPGGG